MMVLSWAPVRVTGLSIQTHRATVGEHPCTARKSEMTTPRYARTRSALRRTRAVVAPSRQRHFPLRWCPSYAGRMHRQPPLTRREQATLQAVGRRLTNAEIADEFGVSVRTVESHIAALRRKLLVESRAEMIEAAQRQLGTQVPSATDSFVGRAAELAEADDVLRGARWLTVTGPAGVGKTRLALEVARRRHSVVVELEHADDVLPAVASALGTTAASPGSLLAACAIALSSGHLLLVLDNADLLIPATTAVVRGLLGRVDSLRVMTTCRTPLHSPGEHVLELAALPTDGPAPSAVELFVHRARAASRTTTLDPDLVASICQRLDGIPLAIELAAARTRHVELAELDRRLAESFDALTVDGATRHGTLDNAFDWSWAVLPANLQSALTQLACLPRTFDLDLAAAILDEPPEPAVSELLDRSLLDRMPGPVEPPRYRMLAALREYVVRQHADTGLVAEVAERHARLHRAIATEMATAARTDDRRSTRVRAHLLCPEISAALRWFVRWDQHEAPALAAAVAIGIEQYGPDADMVRSLIDAAAAPDILAGCDAYQLLAIGHALSYSAVETIAVLAEYAARQDDDLGRLAHAQLLAMHHVYRSEPEQALAHCDIAESLATTRGDRWLLAWVRQTRGMALARLTGADPDNVLGVLESALAGYAEAGDAMHVNNTRYMMAAYAAAAGRAESALRWAEDCLRYAREVDHALETGHAVLTRATAGGATRRRDLNEATQIFRRAGDLRCLARSLLLEAEHTSDVLTRLDLLQDAIEITDAAGDPQLALHAATVRIAALAALGRKHDAAVAYGAAHSRFGDPVDPLLPADLPAALVQDRLAITEGRAQARRDEARFSVPSTDDPRR